MKSQIRTITAQHPGGGIGPRALTELGQGRLVILTLLIFCAFVIAAFATRLYAPSWPLFLSLIVTGAVIAGYTYLILATRQAWILIAISEMRTVDSSAAVTPFIYPRIPWWTHGFFVDEYGRQREAWLKGISAANSPVALQTIATRAYSAAVSLEGSTLMKQAAKALKAESLKANPSPRAVRHYATVVAEHYVDAQWSSDARIMKIQNMLCVMGLILLPLLAAVSTMGWAAPMFVGAISALIVRIQSMIPLGNSFGGGPRWMALLVTPLVGAAAAVLGLIVLSALGDFELLSAKLNQNLNIPAFEAFRGQHRFSIPALALAAAFGWSAKLLDRMLRKLSDYVDESQVATAAAASAPSSDTPADPCAPKHPCAPTTAVESAAQEQQSKWTDAAYDLASAITALQALQKISVPAVENVPGHKIEHQLTDAWTTLLAPHGAVDTAATTDWTTVPATETASLLIQAKDQIHNFLADQGKASPLSAAPIRAAHEALHCLHQSINSDRVAREADFVVGRLGLLP